MANSLGAPSVQRKAATICAVTTADLVSLKREEIQVGKWDKDKEMGRRLDAVFAIGDYLVVHGLEPAGEVATEIGNARKTTVTVSTMEAPAELMEVSTLASAIADKASLPAEPGDFPVVCQLLQVPTKRGGNPALVLQYVRDYTGGEATPTPSAADAPY